MCNGQTHSGHRSLLSLGYGQPRRSRWRGLSLPLILRGGLLGERLARPVAGAGPAHGQEEVVKVDVALCAAYVPEPPPDPLHGLRREVRLQGGGVHHLAKLIVGDHAVPVQVEDLKGRPAHALVLLDLPVDAGGYELGVIDMAALVHVDVPEDRVEVFASTLAEPELLALAFELLHGDHAVAVLVQQLETAVQLVQHALVHLPGEHAGAEVAEDPALVEGLEGLHLPGQGRPQGPGLRGGAEQRQPGVLQGLGGAGPVRGAHGEQAPDQRLGLLGYRGPHLAFHGE
mmetsp:Transcript_2789/g.7745  ORF Transcript_2789/g.7745 Transcript_2789/m.7745 type:complete len:286 (-) Transcript_2789:691-1548(-)